MEDDEGPGGCDEAVVLTPSSGSTPASTTVGPVTLDESGTDVCLHLDGTALLRSHFSAGTELEVGAASSFTLVLRDQDGGTLLDGWDVTIGDIDAHTFVNLEWSPVGGEVNDVVLHARAKSGTATTTLSLALFDPLD